MTEFQVSQKLTTTQIAGACASLGISYQTYAKRPLKWVLGLLETMLPKEKEKTTAEELNNKPKVEVQLWQPPETWKDGQ